MPDAGSRRRLRWGATIGMALVVLAGATEEENWARLRSMPTDRRVFLSHKIEEFDRLSRDERSAVRTLDEKLGSLPVSEQANYRAVLRRYHLWLQTLNADQRKALEAAPAEQRLALMSKYHSEQGRNDNGAEPPMVFQLADLRGRSPFEVAHLLQIWFALSPAQRAEIEKAEVRQRPMKLKEYGPRVKVKPEGHLTKAQVDAALKQMEKRLPPKGPLIKQLRKSENDKPGLDRRRLANNYYFLANPPKPVEPASLFRFESAMPSWIRTTFDHLPPEEAKRRLTILYRLIYPAGTEIPAAKAQPGATPAKPSAPASKPAASTGTPPT